MFTAGIKAKVGTTLYPLKVGKSDNVRSVI